jgi:hypothetical protein
MPNPFIAALRGAAQRDRTQPELLCAAADEIARLEKLVAEPQRTLDEATDDLFYAVFGEIAKAKKDAPPSR